MKQLIRLVLLVWGIVSAQTRPYGHFTGCKKKKRKNNGGWKEETDKIQNCKMQEDEIGTLAFPVCSWLSRELCKNST